LTLWAGFAAGLAVRSRKEDSQGDRPVHRRGQGSRRKRPSRASEDGTLTAPRNIRFVGQFRAPPLNISPSSAFRSSEAPSRRSQPRCRSALWPTN